MMAQLSVPINGWIGFHVLSAPRQRIFARFCRICAQCGLLSLMARDVSVPLRFFANSLELFLKPGEV
ncbi:MAG TPA: hypothetical protein VNE84_07820, partial [Candidatus Limnocylindria bacterium]|nr:hypothetical protein [Candidatus Limnocylindria bacterium]